MTEKFPSEPWYNTPEREWFTLDDVYCEVPRSATLAEGYGCSTTVEMMYELAAIDKLYDDVIRDMPYVEPIARKVLELITRRDCHYVCDVPVGVELPLTEEKLRDIVGSNQHGYDWVQDDPGPETEPCSHAVEVSDVALRNLSQGFK